ncbi:MAG: hypothetical protein IKY33_01280 [Clostridia bacterium]|nr:hypothetical protein [Clostridia bacterium]
MRQSFKRGLSLLLSVLMCVGMLTGIVLPVSAAETAVDRTAAYEELNAATTVIVPEDGYIELEDGTGFDVSEYAGKTIRLPGENFKAFNLNWTEDLGYAEGDYFLAEYGDGETWGNGDVYLLQWGVNAHGAEQYADTTDLGGNVVTDAGTYTGWADMMEDIRHSTPDNWYVLLFPGEMTHATSTSAKETDYNWPAGVDTPDCTQADCTNVNFFGPQAGVSPSAGVVGDTTLMNDRSADPETEMVFTDTIRLPLDGVWRMDGIALSGEAKLHQDVVTNKSYTYLSAMYMNNVYFSLDNIDNDVMFSIGGNNNTNRVVTVFHLTNSYMDGSNVEETEIASENILQGNDILMENVVINNINSIGAGANGLELDFAPSAAAVSDIAFLGDYRNDFNAVVRNCTFDYEAVSNVFGIHNAQFSAYSDAQITIEDNFVRGYTYYFCAYRQGSKASNPIKVGVNIENNYAEAVEVTSRSEVGFVDTGNGYFADGAPLTITGNTIVASADKKPVFDIWVVGSTGLIDLSANLFMSHDGQIRMPRTNELALRPTSKPSVLNDVYASDNKDAGVFDLFTVQETTQDLLVLNSLIVPVLDGYNTYYIEKFGTETVGSITVLPEDGVTYNTEDLFVFKDEGVEYLGVFSDPACTDSVATIEKGFSADGPLYVKAQYEAGNTHAIVVYSLNEPTKYLIVDPTGVGTYTFNGDTYTADNADFYVSMAKAYEAVDVPHIENALDTDPAFLEEVILLMPGTHTTTLNVKDSVAIVGPKFGVDPTVEGSADLSADRSVDPATEAIIGKIVLDTEWSTYTFLTLSGLTANQEGGVTHTIVVDGRYGNQRHSRLNMADMYIKSSGHNLISAPKTDPEYKDYGANNCPIYVNDSYFTDSSKVNYNMYVQATYIRFKDCTIANINPKKSGVSYYPIDPAGMSVPSLTIGWFMEGCYIDGTSTAKPWFTGAYKDIPNGDLLAKGHQLYFVGNTFNNWDGAYIIQTSTNQETPDNSVGITFKNNVVKSENFADTWVIGEANNGAKHKVRDVSGNKLYNYPWPWNFKPDSNVNVDNNFYSVNNELYVLNTNDEFYGSGFEKSSIYWTDENGTETIDMSKFNLRKGEFEEIVLDKAYGDLDEFEATITAAGGRQYNVATAFAANGGTIGEITLDSNGGTLANGVYSAVSGDVLTVPVTYKGYTVTWTVDVYSSNPWENNGLGYVAGETYIDITTSALYEGRANANEGVFVAVAPDWTTFAYTDEALTDPINRATHPELMEATAPTADGDFLEMQEGTKFYAKMPTTGIVYKFTYGVTAINMYRANTSGASTVLVFPGVYNMKTGYSNEGLYASGGNSSNFGIARPGVATDKVVVLGPQAGVAAADTATGAALRDITDTANEAVFSISFYIMNGILDDNDEVIIDGIAGTGAVNFGTHHDTNASYVYSNNNTATFTFENCLIVDYKVASASNGLFSFRAQSGSVGTDITKNTAKMHMILNINSTYLQADPTDTTWVNLGKVNTDEIHIDDSAIIINKNDRTEDLVGFYINPTTGYNNASKHDISYTCENSYLNMPSNYLYGVYHDGTENITAETRNKIEITFNNNKAVDCGIDPAAGNNTRDPLYSSFSAGAENMAITEITFTNNEVTASSYPTASDFGGVIDAGSGEYRSVDISGNVFVGYGVKSVLFGGMSANVDVSDNIYKDLDGTFIAPKLGKVTMSDVILSDDFSIRASDYRPIKYVTADPLSFDNDGTEVYSDISDGNIALIDYTDDLTVSEINEKTEFGSDNAYIYSFANMDGSVVSETIQPGDIFKMVVAHKNLNRTVTYTVGVAGQLRGSVNVNETPLAGKQFFDPAVKNHFDGLNYAKTVNINGADTLVNFVVGENIFGTIAAVPVVDNERHIYLFAKEYAGVSESIGDSTSSGIHNIFYGAQSGISAVADTNVDGVADAMNPARADLSKETVFYNVSLNIDYQNSVTIDGVTFAGESVVTDTGTARTGVVDKFILINCSTDLARPIEQHEENGQPFGFKTTVRSEAEIHDNYLVMTADSVGHMFVGRHIEDMVMTNNYVEVGAAASAVYVSPASSDGTSNIENDFGVVVSGNSIVGGAVNLADLNTTTPVVLNASIDNNHIVATEGDLYGIIVDTVAATNMEGSVISITNNTLETAEGCETVNGFLRIAGLADVVTILGNTFINTDTAPVKYAIINETDVAIVAAGNIFDGFRQTYGLTEHDGTGIAVRANGSAVPVVLTDGDVTSTIIYPDGTSYKANEDNSDQFSIIDAPLSGSSVADTENLLITDISTASDYYKFNTAKGMMIRAAVVDGENTVYYYNGFPLTGETTTVTAVLTQGDGTVIGDTYTVTIVRAPIGVDILDENCRVEDETGAGYTKPFSTYWEGRIVSTNGNDISDLLAKTNFKITDYGMFYGNTAEAVTDEACAAYVATGDSKTVATYSIGGKTVGQKESYENNATGLDSVNLIYSLRMHNVGYGVSRYGRMYLTYEVSGVSHTVYSDVVTLVSEAE